VTESTRNYAVWIFATVLYFSSAAANANLYKLTFDGVVDFSSGFTADGVSAPIGSDFSLDVLIEPDCPGCVTFDVRGVSFSLSSGTYNTISDWQYELTSKPSGELVLDYGWEVNATTEQFALDLHNIEFPALYDPLTWSGSMISGDIMVRGIGGSTSPDQLSAASLYASTLSLTVSQVPVPAAAWLLGSALVALGATRRRRRPLRR